jgi:hypothetical protein
MDVIGLDKADEPYEQDAQYGQKSGPPCATPYLSYPNQVKYPDRF